VFAKHAARGVACFAFAIVFALTSACATRGPLVTANLADSTQASAELASTPFFPQTEYQCGPAALATVLEASGIDSNPETLVPLVYIPERRGSLQIEMQAAPRKFGRLSYVLAQNLDSILAEVSAGRPVLVLHNYGVPLLPRWHYAVVIGYDSTKDNIILRSGVTERQVLSARSFMRAWDNGKRWAMVVLKPGEMPVHADAARYLEVAASFERSASPADARSAFDAATRRWPNESVAWIGRGTAEYRSGNLRAAAKDYSAALRIDGANVGARNNFAMTLLELGCPLLARGELSRIDSTALPPALRAAVVDTRERVDFASEATAGADPPACSALLN
jgi:tetratricopeptide (TPR) repeat protein